MKKAKIREEYEESVINLAMDTIIRGKQALVFVSTKAGSEATAEKIARKAKTSPEMTGISEELLHALPRPTRQCERLARVAKKGVVFHHSGLHHKQREIIEEEFRKGTVRTICCTPTLCLAGDTMLWHGIHETKVAKFQSSNPLFVLSDNNLIKMKAQGIQKIGNESKLIQISSASGYSIKVTPEHKMLVKRKSKKCLIPAKKIRKNDRIATIGKLSLAKNRTPKIKDFIIDNELTAPNSKFNPDLSYLIGIMLGDGYSGAETVEGTIKYKGSPSIVGIDNEIFLSTAESCNALKLKYRKTRTFHGAPQAILGKNKWFREFLVRCGVEKRDRKHISEKLMAMDPENVSSMLKGLFDTDGFVNKKRSVGFSSVSERLARQTQKLLLRFGIVSTVRKRKGSSMKIYEKTYKTLPIYELLVSNKRSILNFYKFIGFRIKRKENELFGLIVKICANFHYVSCSNCDYKVYKDLFTGRTKRQKEKANIRLQVVKLLGKEGESGSREIRRIIGENPRSKESRLNHHYELIKKSKSGSTEWLWSLNPIGKWIYKNIIQNNKDVSEFLKIQKCPLCKKEMDFIIKKGWRGSDFEGDIFWDFVKEIKTVPSEPYVYDVALPDNPENSHMFVANGFVVHNSAGVDLPAFRTILKDLKRYDGRWGYSWIPVLEYQQMSGRAGRPGMEDFGEAIAIASNENEKEEIHERYINGEVEPVYSKLAVEPVLRTYILSLIATEVVRTEKQLIEFFSRTFWAMQYKDTKKLNKKIVQMAELLKDFEFISSSEPEFVSADEIGNNKLNATKLGSRVAQLYIDPLTAHSLITGMKKAGNKPSVFSMLQLVSYQLELRPRLRLRKSDYERVNDKILSEDLLVNEPVIYDPEYSDFLDSVKTAMFFEDWIGEKTEEELLEKYNVRPGEIKVKTENAEWLLYSAEELAKMIERQDLVKEIIRLRFRVINGVKEDVLPLLQLKGVGRVKSRRLLNNKIKTLKDIKEASLTTLSQVIGAKTAASVKEQLGEKPIKIPERKRKGQLSLLGYKEKE